MRDAFKHVANQIEWSTDAKPHGKAKTTAHRVARARLKHSDHRLFNKGIETAEWEALEANDNCGDPHCCECGDGEGCEGCFFCQPRVLDMRDTCDHCGEVHVFGDDVAGYMRCQRFDYWACPRCEGRVMGRFNRKRNRNARRIRRQKRGW